MNRRGAVERRISMLAPRCFYKIEQIILGVNTLVKEKAVLEMKISIKVFPECALCKASILRFVKAKFMR